MFIFLNRIGQVVPVIENCCVLFMVQASFFKIMCLALFMLMLQLLLYCHIVSHRLRLDIIHEIQISFVFALLHYAS